MTIFEPATLLTDVLLAILAGALAWRLWRRVPTRMISARWWSGVLALTAVSALVGGGYHGFGPNFSASVHSVWWIFTLLAVCLISVCLALSLMHELVPVARQKIWRPVIALKFAAFAGAAISHPDFIVVIIDYGLVLLAWVVAALLTGRRWRGWLLGGIGLSISAAVVQQAQWSLAAHFNHNDLFHVIQALGLLALYRAGRLFTGPGAAAAA